MGKVNPCPIETEEGGRTNMRFDGSTGKVREPRKALGRGSRGHVRPWVGSRGHVRPRVGSRGHVRPRVGSRGHVRPRVGSRGHVRPRVGSRVT
ncbi:hypothetical protein ACOMHN_004318 [Nucella lapillus]